MAILMSDLSEVIAGPFRIIERMNQKDEKKHVLYRVECVCGTQEFASRQTLEKLAGYGLTCPTHPILEAEEKPVEDFQIYPGMKEEPEYSETLAAWITAASGVSATGMWMVHIPEPEATPEVEPPPADAVTTTNSDDHHEATPIPTPEATSVHQDVSSDELDNDTHSKANKVLENRLGLTGYTTISIALTEPVALDGVTAERVVFAKQISGEDRVFLHLLVVNPDGKKSIISSRKRVPTSAWQRIADELVAKQITWRDRAPRRHAV